MSKAVVIATGLRADGHREVLGVDIGDSETEAFWTEFLGELRDRGLVGALLVEINDEMIAAERRYIAASSVAEIDGIEPALQSLPAASSD